MDKETAKKLVRETFNKPFDREAFVRFTKELFNFMDEAGFVYRGKYIPVSFAPYIQTLLSFSDSATTEKNKIDVLIVQLKKATSLERARTMQRNFIAWYLNGSRGGELKDAALVAFVSPEKDDWRFSLVKMDYQLQESATGRVKVKQELTPARRWSFLVGKNENTHTAQKQLIDLLQNDADSQVLSHSTPLLADFERAFNIEKVTKEFFAKYRDLFLWAKEALDEILKKEGKIRSDFETKDIATVNFAKKLLGQIVFLYFLQKKGWFGVARDADWGTGPKGFLRELFDGKHGKYQNFFNDMLEPLFYEALRIDRSHDDDYYSKLNCRIPFLNGGLFDPIGNYDWVHTDILLPNELFSNNKKTKEGDVGTGILDIFDRYNFTVKEDEPLEKDVAIDPEMLGKVFENLLEVKDRKSRGTYYTPREIVHYMCQESLINYLYSELNSSDILSGKSESQSKLFGKPDPEQIKFNINSEISITKEDIETLIKHGDTAVEHDAVYLEKLAANPGYKGKYEKSKLPKSIERNAQAIDEKLASIRVCDPAVGSGAFLVGMMNEVIRTRNALTTYLGNGGRSVYDFKRQAIQNCLYGVDIDPGAVETAKLRLWLSLVVDEEDMKHIKPLPNLDYKVVCGNSLLEFPYTPRGLEKIEQLKQNFFEETRPKVKEQLRSEISAAIRKSLANTERSLGYKVNFDFKIFFSEVFHEKKGFDVVIANPPYVKEYVNRSAFDGLRNSPYYQGKMDLWYLFACKGIDLAKNDSGIVTFIAHNNWVTSYGASKMRNKVIKESQILSLIDFGDFKIFEAGIQTMVMIFQKNTRLDDYSFDYRKLRGKNLGMQDVVSILNKESSGTTEYLTPMITRGNLVNKKLTFSNSEIDSILEKISNKTNFNFDPKKEVAQGIVCPQDSVNKSTQQLLGKNYRVGDGIFVLSGAELKALGPSKNELSLVKPFYTTDELKRWCGEKKNKRWIIYTGSSFKNKKKIENYPNIKKHLDQFRKVITSDNKPYGLHRARDEYFFKGEKIIAVRKCSKPTFTYTDFDCYVSATFYVIKSKRINLKYLTALLNSKLIAFWLKHKGKMQGNNYQIDKEPLLALPLKYIPKEEQKPFINLVDKILSITKDEDYSENPAKQAKVREYEKQIDQLVYQLYGLTTEEIEIVESSQR